MATKLELVELLKKHNELLEDLIEMLDQTIQGEQDKLDTLTGLKEVVDKKVKELNE